MEWGSSRILALRKHAGMTQAKFAQWLGVSIKQVKYLEHQRRNPSGPTRRLLDILAAQFHFDCVETVLVLGANARSLQPSSGIPKPSAVLSEQPRDDKNKPAKSSRKTPVAHSEPSTSRGTVTPTISNEDDAFVWQ